jgi:SecD/SecF fusion protein
LLRRLLESPAARPYWPADVRFILGEDPGYSHSGILVYAIKNQPARLTNQHITQAMPGVSPEGRGFQVTFNFDAWGTAEWERMTTRNVGKPIAICLNDKVMYAPVVYQPISGGTSVITCGTGGLESCRAMSILLTSKELPLPIQVNHARFSPAAKLLSPAMNYVLLFVLSFAIAFGVQWLIIRLDKA